MASPNHVGVSQDPRKGRLEGMGQVLNGILQVLALLAFRQRDIKSQ